MDESTRLSAETTQMSAFYQRHSRKTMLGFSFGPLADQMSHQMFQFLVFTFYYAVAQVRISILMWSFVIFTIWDSINDPLLGPLSDKTRSKFGKRGVWILLSTIPFGILNTLLFTVGMAWPEMTKAFYMIIIIMAYDTVYTIFSCNQLALFGEMFKSEEERGTANAYKSVFTIVGVIIGFVIPTIFIKPMAPSETTPAEVVAKIPGMYVTKGIIVGILVIITGFIFYRYGRVENTHQYEAALEREPSLLIMLKDTIKNGGFVIFCVANLVKWFVFKLFTTILPLYAIHVLGLTEGNFLISALLLVALLSAAIFFPIMRNIGLKIGWRNAFILSQIIWMIAVIPFWFLDNQPMIALLCMVFMGIGLSGAMYYVEPIIATLIDEDEVKTGTRRSGSFYGINGLINRYSTILVFVMIAVVLSGYGWEQYLIGAGLDYEGLRMGLKLLMVPISLGGLILEILFLFLFPLHGQRLKVVQKKLHELRVERFTEH